MQYFCHSENLSFSSKGKILGRRMAMGDEEAESPGNTWLSQIFCLTLRERNNKKIERMKIFALFFFLAFGIVRGAAKLIEGIVRLAWLLLMLLCRVFSELVSDKHCVRA